MDLFHSTPPAWYDPWGYNRPGDFVSTQPSPTYLDPFCFDGQLKFPQRPLWAEAALATLGCGATIAAVWVANSYPWPVRIA